MMGNSIFRHAIPMGILLTISQISSVISSPVWTTTADDWDIFDGHRPESTAFRQPEPTRTVLESENGVVYVPILTLTSSVPYTTDGITGYSATILTSYYTSYSTSTITHGFGLTRRSTGPVLSTKTPDTSSYTISLSSALTSLSSSAVQTASSSVETHTSGSIATSLETAGETSVQPFATSIAGGTSGTISLIDTSRTSIPQPTMTTTASTLSVSNIFVNIAGDAVPPQVTTRSDHPVARLGIASQSKKLETNKFYANFYLGSQTSTSFTHPYSVAWAKGAGAAGSYGLAVSHIERSQLSFGSGTPAPFFINPIGIQSLILSASELGTTTNLTTDSLDAFSVNVNLSPAPGAAPVVTFPLLQGMGYVTGIYSAATPRIESSVSFSSITYVGVVASTSTAKYRALLADGTTWVIYVTTSQTGYPVNALTLTNSRLLQGAAGFNGYIQIAKLQIGSTQAEGLYDASAGVYPVSATISGSVSGTTGTYGLSWTKQGITSRKLLMYGLPHQLDVITRSSVNVTTMQLETTTKGLATAIVGDAWTLVEPSLPIDMGFAPWTPTLRSINSVSSAAAALINQAGTTELGQDIHAQSYLDSMYYSGKALAKFAAIIYSLHDIVGNTTLAATGLQKLETAFAAFVNNTQIYPLVYDSAWGGVVSSGTYKTGDSGLDFGNTYYNDHHFHYGYFVYAASVIGYLDPAWVTQGTNKEWVNMLVRDYGNSVTNGGYFPFSRSFDWFHGHSWAKGLFESGDGKDQESSSEDAMASYGMKMWGRTIGDQAMEARGILMLAMQARSFQKYFLYSSDNTVEPAQFIGNKVSGILFENKIDHTTYFGSNTEYIEGIHMLPIMPFSALTRTQKFVTEEWNTYFSNGRAEAVVGGWNGVLHADLAIINASSSYAFFSNSSFDMGLLDGGASLTWYLTYSAALGGSSAGASAAVSKRERQRDVPTRFERVVGTPGMYDGSGSGSGSGSQSGVVSRDVKVDEKNADAGAGKRQNQGGNPISRFFKRMTGKVQRKRQ